MTLFLLPNVLAQTLQAEQFLPPIISSIVASLQALFVESPKGGRHFLALFGKLAQTLPTYPLNEHTTEKTLYEYIEMVRSSKARFGIVSDSGLPSLADPGASLVFLAHRFGIKVEYPAPSSAIIATLLLSGLPANHFTFHGYLPIATHLRKQALIDLERRSAKEGSSQIFIETPYRNVALLKSCLETLQPKSWLACGYSLGTPAQGFILATVEEWRQRNYTVGKQEATFIVYTPS